MFIEVGGGIRDEECIKQYLDLGVDRVILGTAAVKAPKFLREISQPAATAAASNHPRWTLTSPAEASRFLAQASYGSSPKDIKSLTGRTANEWIETQFSRPPTSLLNTIRYWQQRSGKAITLTDAHNAWWYSTVQQDQLRQRVAFALSQIFVVSTNGDVSHFPKGIAGYYDMLARNAFGNFR